MKKPSTPIKKKGGPNTAKGKLIASQNAIKTGVTAKQLLNEQEFNRFSQLQEDLNHHYSGTNPLIPLQIDKIARMQIQLERIQNAIDALYRQSEMNPPRKEKKDSSPVDSATLSLHLRIRLGLFDPSIIQKIRTALFQMNIKKILAEPMTHDDSDENEQQRPVINQESLLGTYLFAEASFYKQELADYLNDKIAAVTNSRSAKDLYQKLNIEVLNHAIDLMRSPDPKQFIIAHDYYEFRQFNDWFELQLRYLSEQLNELESLTDEKQAFANIPMPNFDDLDRLMRYQTNISKQLSTAIGELMILAKQ